MGGEYIYSYIYISIMLLNYNHKKMSSSSPTSPNMSSFGKVCNRLGKTFLTSLVIKHWATGGLRVNFTPDYNLSFVPARGEYNIAGHTLGKVSKKKKMLIFLYCPKGGGGQ